MLPVLPTLSNLSGVLRSSQSSTTTNSTSRNTARTATRTINQPNFNQDGDNREVINELQTLVNSLQESLKKLQKPMNDTTSSFKNMGKIIKNSVITPLKTALGVLNSMFKVARNLVMAFGAMAIGALWSNMKNQIDKHRSAGLANVDARQFKAYNRAKAMMGLKDGEFDLAQLQTILGSNESYGLLGQIGLSRDELVGLNGIDAGKKVDEAIGRMLEHIPQNAPVWDSLADAVMKLRGVDIRNAKNRELFTPSKQKEFGREIAYFYKTLNDTSSLVEAQKAVAKVQYKIKDLGESLAVTLAPYVSMVADKISQFLHDPEKMAGLGDTLSSIFNTLGNGIKMLKEIFTKDVLSSILDSLDKIGSSLLTLGQIVLPYFVKGLETLSSIMQGIVDSLTKEGYLKEKIKGLGGDLLDIGKYGFDKLTGNLTTNEDLDKIVADGRELFNRRKAENELQQSQNKQIFEHNVNVNLRYPDGATQSIQLNAGGGGN